MLSLTKAYTGLLLGEIRSSGLICWIIFKFLSSGLVNVALKAAKCAQKHRLLSHFSAECIKKSSLHIVPRVC